MSSWGVDGRLHRCLVFCAQICATVAFIVGLTTWADVALASSPFQRADARYDYDAVPTVAPSDAANPGALVVRVVRLDGDGAPASSVGGHAYDSAASLVAPGSLVDELAAAGIKHDPANIVRIARDGSGRVVFLETGNSRAGLAHIVGEHADDFAARGVTVDQIPDLVTNAASQGRIVGYQGTGTGPPVLVAPTATVISNPRLCRRARPV